MIEQKTSKQQTEQHDKTSEKVSNALVLEHNADEEADRCSSKVEQNQEENKSEKLCPRWSKAGHWVGRLRRESLAV